MSEFVRVTYPGVEGTPLVPAKRAARMVERGWSVVDDQPKKTAEPSPKKSADNPSPEKPDSRAESNTNKEM